MSDEKKETVSKGTVKIKITDPAGWLYEGKFYLEGSTVEVPQSVHKSMTEGKVKSEIIS